MSGPGAGVGGRGADTLALAVAVALHVAAFVIVSGPTDGSAFATVAERPEIALVQIEVRDPIELPTPEDSLDQPVEVRNSDPHAVAPTPAPDLQATGLEESVELPSVTDPLDAAEDLFADTWAESARFQVLPKARKRTRTVRARPRNRGPRPSRAGAKAKYPAALDSLVRRNYPRHARAEGVEGVAEAHVRLSATGQVLNVRVADVSHGGWGFGEACARSIHQVPKWIPKRDNAGNPVSSLALYPCRFRLP